MAGGIGSRFWPFSRADKPKQLLDFFGTGRSLLQMTIDRFRPLVPIENMIVATNVAYKEQILAQVPDMKEDQVLCEPARRNTAPCIAYAVEHIRAIAKSEDVNIVVAASDHLIMEEDKFRQTIAHAFDFVSEHDAILTLGMKPTRPETGYGYIQYIQETSGSALASVSVGSDSPSAFPFQSQKSIGFSTIKSRVCLDKVSTTLNEKYADIYPVKTFTEKPNLEMAKVFLESGEFLWNSGIFIWNMRTIRAAFEQHLPEVARLFKEGEQWMGTDREEAFIEDIFPKCPNISIDYGVMEKAQNVFVLPSDFGWSDLGTWGSLYELSKKDETGNVSLHSQALFYDSKDNIVTLESGKLAVVQGMEDMIVAEENGVLLICKKGEEQRIKQFVADAQEKFEGRYN